MRWLLTISFLFLFLSVLSQDNLTQLSKEITKSAKSEKEKVTAIFQWITNNISYGISTSIDKGIESSITGINNKTEVKNYEFKSLSERVAEKVVREKVAVCDGYTRLFTTLCGYAGIRSEIIAGFAKSGSNTIVRRFGVNHYWNAVMIDSNWYLADPTWASGYFSGNEFIKEYDGDYFLTVPQIFIKDHYPDDARWTLLKDSEVTDEFRSSPFKQKSFSKYKFNAYYPVTGVIETFVGDTIRLKLETAKSELERKVSPCSITDSTIFSYSPSWVFINPDKKNTGTTQNEFSYNYTIASAKVEWLYLLYNDDLVLKYKINVR